MRRELTKLFTSLFGPVATSPGHGIKEKFQVVDKVTGRMDDSTWNSKVMMSVQKARTECAQKSRSKGKTNDEICYLNSSMYEGLLEHVQGQIDM